MLLCHIADDVNVVASAYGKRNFDALLSENGQNVIYTKENKSINQLLDNRLQLPELVADDTLVDYSIRRSSGNSNRFGENSANIMQDAVQYNITKIKEIPDTSGKYATPLAQSTSTFGNLNNDSIAPDNTNGNTSGSKFEGQQIAKGTVPLSEVMQYGKTPEQAADGGVGRRLTHRNTGH